MSLGIITLLCKKGEKNFAPRSGAKFLTLPTTCYDPFASFPLAPGGTGLGERLGERVRVWE